MMKRLEKNYWRLGWVLVTNASLIFLLLIGPIRTHYQQQLIYENMRTTAPPFSYLKELFASPWVPVMILVLLVGIIAEMRRAVVSSIFNVGPYLVWLLVALWERARVAGEATAQELFLGKVFLIFPLSVIIAVDLVFYVIAFRRRQGEGGVAHSSPPSA